MHMKETLSAIITTLNGVEVRVKVTLTGCWRVSMRWKR